jgi:hypothetical protein
LGGRILHIDTAPAAAFKLFTETVDNAVENVLGSVAFRSLCYADVILVKKPSKKNFPQTFQTFTPLCDDGALVTDDNRSRAGG